MKKEIKKTKIKESSNIRKMFEEFGKKIEKRMLEISHESEKKFERYVGSLSEEFQSRLSAVAEGVTGLSEKIDILTARLDKMENTLNSHTEMIGNIMENVEVMKSDIHTIKNELKQKVSYDEFTQLEKRVIHLEQKILH